MVDTDIQTAWSLWLDGQQVQSLYLWGWKIVWWGRLGKILELIGALMGVAEVLSGTRLADHRMMFTAFSAKVFFRPHWVLLMFLLGGLLAHASFRAWTTHDWGWQNDVGLPVWIVALLLTAMAAGMLLVQIFAVLALPLLLAWGRAASRPKFHGVMRLCAFMVFTAGFHFDLLAS